jgi:hypothetical protein
MTPEANLLKKPDIGRTIKLCKAELSSEEITNQEDSFWIMSKEKIRYQNSLA